MNNTIFIMTVVSGDPDCWKWVGPSETQWSPTPMRSRCWGYYFHRNDAEEAIKTNATDISELGYYRYAVLSELEEGPCSLGEELQWYEFVWNHDVPPGEFPKLVEVKEITKPEKYEGFCFSCL